MSHKDLNPVNRKNPKRVAIVISNPAVSTTTNWPVGFWWSELSHPYFRFTELGYEVEIFSPEGGACVADAMSDPEDTSQWQAEDVISRGYKHDPDFMNLVLNTKTVDEISLDAFDAIVVAGGEGPMFTMWKATKLHAKFAELFGAGTAPAALRRVVQRRPAGEGSHRHRLHQHRGGLRRIRQGLTDDVIVGGLDRIGQRAVYLLTQPDRLGRAAGRG